MTISRELRSFLSQSIKNNDFYSTIVSTDLEDLFYVDYSDKEDYVTFIPTKKIKDLIVRINSFLLCEISHDIYDKIRSMIDISKIDHQHDNTNSQYKIIDLYKDCGPKYSDSYYLLHLESVDTGKQKIHIVNKREDTTIELISKEKLQEVKIGRFLSKITDHPHFNIMFGPGNNYDSKPINKNKLIEETVNSYKSYKKYLNSIEEYLSVVKGEDIKTWYHEDKYEPRSGTLSNSCMRYDRCQDYFNIYINNGVEMLILKNEQGKLIGRALLWETNEGKYMDRIYGKDHIQILFKKWATDNGYDLRFDLGSKVTKSVNVNLQDKFPYMDTFKFMFNALYDKEGLQEVLLTNNEPTERTMLDILNDTNGSYTKNHTWRG